MKLKFKKDKKEKKLFSVKLPPIDMKLLFFIGTGAFLIQSICSIMIFFINLEFQNFWSATSTWAMIIFNLFLAYFFYYSYKSLSQASVVSEEVNVEDQEFINDFFKKGSR